mmetsp:Transcript_60754/g.137365  ORF Transcript_60754/g.137365 Transcript_60754/m.137365 type:complete len:212 (+) Transcript_60754:390-1025(+)
MKGPNLSPRASSSGSSSLKSAAALSTPLACSCRAAWAPSLSSVTTRASDGLVTIQQPSLTREQLRPTPSHAAAKAFAPVLPALCGSFTATAPTAGAPSASISEGPTSACLLLLGSRLGDWTSWTSPSSSSSASSSSPPNLISWSSRSCEAPRRRNLASTHGSLKAKRDLGSPRSGPAHEGGQADHEAPSPPPMGPKPSARPGGSAKPSRGA